jgi:site-specific DNA-methyltransferase (adenine-specific)
MEYNDERYKKVFGEVFTPISLCNEMLDKLPQEVWSNPDLKWLDPSCGSGNFLIAIKKRLMTGLRYKIRNKEEREKHILENMLFGVDIQPKNILLTMLRLDPNNQYNLDNIFLFDALEYEFNQTFDIIVANPPYNTRGNPLHLKFLSLACDLSKKYILFVEPIAWLITERKEIYSKLYDKIQNTLQDVTILNINPIFNIFLFVPGGILLFDKDNDGNIKVTNKLANNRVDIYENIQDINIHGNIKEYCSLKNKILNYCEKNSSLARYRYSDGQFYVNVGKIRANVYMDKINELRKSDFYTFVPNDRKVETEKRQQYFGFKEYNEAENFLAYIRTKFARFCLSIFKFDANIGKGTFQAVPWLDFSIEWTDKMLHEYFQLSNDEIRFIEEFIPDY